MSVCECVCVCMYVSVSMCMCVSLCVRERRNNEIDYYVSKHSVYPVDGA